MAGIFISYRRADSEGWAGRLSDSLKAELGRVNIFRDIEDIPPGVEFDTYITNAVSSCDVLIALIGPHWLTAANSAGQRRLDDPKDFTRLEIVGALERNIRVIPTLVGNAELPSADDLPEDIRPLVRRQTYELSDARWADDCRRLAAVLRPIVKRESWLTKKIAAGLLAAAVAIGGGGVWHWYDQQSERARIAAETQRQAEELRIAQEKQAQDKIIREKKEKEEAEDRLAREEAEHQAAAKKDAKAKQDALNAAAAKRDAVNRAQNALAASSRMVSRIALLVRQGSDFAKRAEIAAISAGRYRAPNQAILETIRRAREAGAKASSAYRELKDTEPDANQQLTAVKEFAAAAEQTADNAAAARASESATRAAEKIKYVSSLAEQKLQIARDLAQAAEAALEEVKAALGDDGTSDALSITSITPPTSTTLRARAPQVLTVYLRSTLASTDRAILAVFLEQYPESAGGCVGATHRTSDGTNISIERGTRNLKASVRSPGGSAGFYLGVGVNLWSDSGGRPGKRIRAFGVFPQYCFRVLP